MTPTPVTLTGAQPATPPATPPVVPPVAAAADAAALQKQIDDLRAENAEKDRTAQFWYNKANRQPEPVKPTPAAADEPEVDVLELATKGGKAFESYMTSWAKKQGFVKGEEMQEAISTKAAELAAQGKLVSQYPELKNEKSEFFQATAAEYGALKKRGIAEVDAMEMAAERVELRFLREGKMKTPAQQKADADAQKAQERRERAAAGGGDRGSRAPAEAEDDDTLSPDDERAVAQLADGLDIPLDQARERYIKRAKAGVRVALKLDRRGR